MKESMIPLITRQTPQILAYTVSDLGVPAEPTNDGALLRFLYGIIDAQILHELGMSIDFNLIKDTVPYSISHSVIRNGIPSDETMLQKLYQSVYYEITYPLFIKQYGLDPYIPNNYATRSAVEQSSKRYAMNEAKIFHKQLKNAISYVTSISNDVKIDSKKYLNTINENPTISRYQAIKTASNNETLPTYDNVPNMDFQGYIDSAIGYIENASEFESILFANALTPFLKQNPYNFKTWIWSGKRRTRHRGMNFTTVPVYEPYTVINDKTGETAQLMFPRDFARDPTGANTINCACTELFTQEEKDFGQ